MMTLLCTLLALLVVMAAVQVAHTRRNGRASMLLLSLGAVSTRWLTEHRGEQQ
jgi:hypothetical protein